MQQKCRLCLRSLTSRKTEFFGIVRDVISDSFYVDVVDAKGSKYALDKRFSKHAVFGITNIFSSCLVMLGKNAVIVDMLGVA